MLLTDLKDAKSCLSYYYGKLILTISKFKEKTENNQEEWKEK